MKIKTIDEYRALIRKDRKGQSKAQSVSVKYFVAGYMGAVDATQSKARKANKKLR